MSTPNDPYGQPQYSSPPPYPGQQVPGGYPGQYPGGYQPHPGYAPVPQGQQQDPDSTLGIVGLILAVAACAPAGLIISWIALNKSKERGYKNTPAQVGVILGGVFSALALLAVVGYIVFVVILVGASSSTSLL